MVSSSHGALIEIVSSIGSHGHCLGQLGFLEETSGPVASVDNKNLNYSLWNWKQQDVFLFL